jgi:hypothetical protein
VIAFPLETEVGRMRILMVYVGGVLSGSLAASVSSDFSLMVGASSGIYSLLMSHIPHTYVVSREKKHDLNILNLQFFSSTSHQFLIVFIGSFVSLYYA